MDYRNELKKVLAARGITHRAIAHIIGTCPLTVANKINGKSDFYLNEIKKICKAFRISFLVFFEEEYV